METFARHDSFTHFCSTFTDDKTSFMSDAMIISNFDWSTSTKGVPEFLYPEIGWCAYQGIA
ncbi:MAG: hypothetical protein MI717_01395 [Spirochaetales bacterium]|nr:hypothetical protein [Spirochaetales bacterium]